MNFYCIRYSAHLAGERERDRISYNWLDLATQTGQALLGSRIKGLLIGFGALPCGYTPANPG